MQQHPILGESQARPEPPEAPEQTPEASGIVPAATEIGGRDGPEPTRYGDWEKNGRCIDF